MRTRLLGAGLLMALLIACGGGSSDGADDATTTTKAAASSDNPNKAACTAALYNIGTGNQDAKAWADLAEKYQQEGADQAVIVPLKLLGVSLGKKDTVSAKASATQLAEVCKPYLK